MPSGSSFLIRCRKGELVSRLLPPYTSRWLTDYLLHPFAAAWSRAVAASCAETFAAA